MQDIETAVRGLVDAIRAELPSTSDSEPDRLLSIPDAAGALGIGRSMLYGEISAGRLRSVKVGRRRLIPSGAIRDYVDRAGVSNAA